MTSPAQLYLFAMEIKLTKGYVALVDPDEYSRVAANNWSADEIDGHIYAVRRERGRDGVNRKIYMHRFIMRAKRGQEIGHGEGIGLDNRKENLRRIVKRSYQRANDKTRKDNTSGCRGIRIMKRKSGSLVYLVRVSLQGKEYHGGTFKSMEKAVAGRNKLAAKLFGRFAKAS